MIVHDKNIAWRRKRLFLPFYQWAWGSLGGGTNTQLVGAFYGNKITSAGTPVQGAFRMPFDVNPDFDMGFKICYAGDGTAPEDVGTLSWIILAEYKAVTVAPDATAVGALDTTIATTGVVSATDNLLEWTSRGIKNKGFLSRDEIDAGAYCQFSVELDAVGGTISATNFVLCMGLEIDYMPRKTRFPHSEIDGPLDSAAP